MAHFYRLTPLEIDKFCGQTLKVSKLANIWCVCCEWLKIEFSPC